MIQTLCTEETTSKNSNNIQNTRIYFSMDLSSNLIQRPTEKKTLVIGDLINISRRVAMIFLHRPPGGKGKKRKKNHR